MLTFCCGGKVQSQASSCGICGGQSGIETQFSVSIISPGFHKHISFIYY
jgi:hypothetical protein